MYGKPLALFWTTNASQLRNNAETFLSYDGHKLETMLRRAAT